MVYEYMAGGLFRACHFAENDCAERSFMIPFDLNTAMRVLCSSFWLNFFINILLLLYGVRGFVAAKNSFTSLHFF